MLNMMLGTGDIKEEDGEIIGGYNEIPNYGVDSEGNVFIIPPMEASQIPGFSKNSIIVKIDDSQETIDFFKKQGKDTKNHEAGHFFILATEKELMKEYYEGLNEKGIKINGGHNEDDPSGIEADKWEKQ